MSDPADTITTVVGSATAAIGRIKGARFIGDIARVENEQSARAFLESVREREPSATHHCWAFRLGSGRALSSDDGEPRDTGGPPILRRIEGAGLSDVAVVVTRYYGGTNLGRGGLIRAYGDAAARVIDEATIEARPVMVRLEIDYPYELAGRIEGAITAAGAERDAARFAEGITASVSVPIAGVDGLVSSIVELSAGSVRPVLLTDEPNGRA